MQREIAVIGIDPAASKPSAYAIAYRESVISCGNLTEDLEQLFYWFKLLQQKNSNWDIQATVEDQYNDKSWRELKRLAAARGRIEGIAAAAGITVLDPVNPSSWQTAVFRTRRPPKRGKMRDHLLIQYAEARIDPAAVAGIGNARCPTKLTVDHAAAIHIAMYKYQRVLFGTRLLGANI